MDTFEILSEIYEIMDESIAKGFTFQDALTSAEVKISNKYHISFISLKRMVGN